jgi:sugar/nucleoside kinase (ribokinase family)
MATDSPRSAIWDVVGVGASCIDHVCRMPVFPVAGADRSKIRLDSESRMCGGQTATALAACQSFGLRTKYVGTVGQDDDGARICRELESRGIDVTDVVRVADAPTATATILIDASGDRLVLWHRDARLVTDPGRIPLAAINAARLVHVDDVDEAAAIAAAKAARAAGRAVTCDVDHVAARTDELLSHVSIPIFAEHLPRLLTGEADTERALRTMRRHHPGLLVVTLGDRGAAALDGDTFIHVPAFAIEAVDTTGAGDVFRAGFIQAWLGGRSLADTLRMANAAAAAKCMRLGAMGGVPPLEAVRALLGRAQ